MAAKPKAGKKTPAKKTPKAKPAKVNKVTAVKKSKPTRAAASSRKPSAAAKGVKTPAITPPKNEWHITLVFGNATGVYGLASDGRIYRWNTRSALWVLHKDGLTA
jgi:hypothetical protein